MGWHILHFLWQYELILTYICQTKHFYQLPSAEWVSHAESWIVSIFFLFILLIFQIGAIYMWSYVYNIVRIYSSNNSGQKQDDFTENVKSVGETTENLSNSSMEPPLPLNGCSAVKVHLNQFEIDRTTSKGKTEVGYVYISVLLSLLRLFLFSLCFSLFFLESIFGQISFSPALFFDYDLLIGIIHILNWKCWGTSFLNSGFVKMLVHLASCNIDYIEGLDDNVVVSFCFSSRSSDAFVKLSSYVASLLWQVPPLEKIKSVLQTFATKMDLRKFFAPSTIAAVRL